MLNPVYKEQSRSLYWIISPAATSVCWFCLLHFIATFSFSFCKPFCLRGQVCPCWMAAVLLGLR